MRTYLFHFSLILLLVQTAFGQMTKPNNKLTPNELKAVREISVTFTRRINETGDITSMFNELFVGDFIERYIKEKKREIAQNIKLYRPEFFDPKKVTFVLFLNFNADLLDKATTEDWKRLYISTFNYRHFETVSWLNELAKDQIQGGKPDLEKMVKIYEKIYPSNVFQLFDQHSNLKGFIRKKFSSEPIKTVEELQSVIETLEQGLKLLNEGKNGKPAVEFSEGLLKLYAKLKIKAYFGETVEIAKDEFWGFPKGTRYISVYLPPVGKLYLFKVAGKYKIILKTIP